MTVVLAYFYAFAHVLLLFSVMLFLVQCRRNRKKKKEQSLQGIRVPDSPRNIVIVPLRKLNKPPCFLPDVQKPLARGNKLPIEKSCGVHSMTSEVLAKANDSSAHTAKAKPFPPKPEMSNMVSSDQRVSESSMKSPEPSTNTTPTSSGKTISASSIAKEYKDKKGNEPSSLQAAPPPFQITQSSQAASSSQVDSEDEKPTKPLRPPLWSTVNTSKNVTQVPKSLQISTRFPGTHTLSQANTAGNSRCVSQDISVKTAVAQPEKQNEKEAPPKMESSHKNVKFGRSAKRRPGAEKVINSEYK